MSVSEFVKRITRRSALAGLAYSGATAANIISTGSGFLSTGLGPLSTAASGTAAVLSSPTNGTPGTTSVTIGATTTEASGTLYVVVDTSGNLSGITAAQIAAGHNNTGSAAAGSANAAVSTTTPTANVAGLTANTSYSYAIVQLNNTGASNIVTGTFTTAMAGAVSVFNFANFSSSPSSITLVDNASFAGANLQLLPAGSSHLGCGAGYNTQQPPSAFTVQFTFQPQGLGSSVVASGFCFVLQNTYSPPCQNAGIPNFGGDANMCGYGGSISQFPPVDAIAIKFDAGNQSTGQTYQSGGFPSTTGLYLNQGPSVYQSGSGGTGSLGLCPCNDLAPYGINFYSGDTFEVTIVYDGSLLTMVIADTASGAQARVAWPLNLANSTNATGNYVGFGAGRSTVGYYNIQSWAYWSGYNTRLATPTFSVTPGNYTTSQTVTISYPAGSTCYYTTNGLLPTSSSTQYTGPITVSANTVLQAVAIQSGYTDSLVASGNYVVGTSSYTIDFPSGFSAGNLIPVGFAYLSGSTYRVSDTTNNTGGAVWFPVPVTVSTFSTTFSLDWGSGGQGMCFVIQNNTQPYTGLTGVQITGTSGEISFNATEISVGQYVTIAGTFGGAGSISGYSNPATYLVSATNGSTTATLCAAGCTSISQLGVTFTTSPQSLIVGTQIVIIGTNPGGFVGSYSYYVLSSGLTSTTCQLALTPGGTAVSATSSVACTFVIIGGGGGGNTLTTTAGTPTGLTYSLNARSWSGGPTVIGAANNGLGFGGLNAINGTPGQSFGLLNSVAVVFNQYSIGSSGDPTNGVGLYTNGENPYGSQVATGLSFVGSYNVTLTYDGTTLSISMQSTGGGSTFTQNWTINIPSIVGANTAYVGFTGGTGGAASIEAITAWTL